MRVDRVERHADGRRGNVGNAVGGGDHAGDAALLGQRHGQTGAAGEAGAGETETRLAMPKPSTIPYNPVANIVTTVPTAAISAPHRIKRAGRGRARDQPPLRGERGRGAGHHDDGDRLFGPRGASPSRSMDEEAEAGQHRRLGMARDDPGDDPVADARSRHLSRATRGAVEATTLAPVGEDSSDG